MKLIPITIIFTGIIFLFIPIPPIATIIGLALILIGIVMLIA